MESLDSTRYDVVVMLQPTSPLRRPAHVMAALEKLVAEGWDAVWTVSPTALKYHPLKQLTVLPNGTMDYYDPAGPDIIARQQLTPVYYRNGAAYAFTRGCLLEQGTIRGARTGAVVIDDPMISIDTLEDFRLAEQMLAK
jgi:CMP-N-acetylneuraminic acid synthetase